ncbi:MAG TPA: Cof-type HAD-IIB family hydrolase [Acidimicrobiales bacterium]|nr:Cof-type HAD-IIB family hydrolase [Acidimicrobiales bacterium]
MSGPLVRLVLSDVDGTLVTSTKELTRETVRAVEHLGEAGILFAVTSGRPPRGLRMLIDPLELTTPLAGFNGGLIVRRDLVTMQELVIRDEIVGPIIEVLRAHGLSVWVYQGTQWFVLDLDGAHVAHEATVCQFVPTELDDFDGVRGDVVKVVGVSDDPATIETATAALNDAFSLDVSATSSQTYYIDVTHQDANKGRVVDFLADTFSLETEHIATIGDMSNDVLMFDRSGLSIAMGNATDEVKSLATRVTTSNDENGFANAVERYVLNTSR